MTDPVLKITGNDAGLVAVRGARDQRGWARATLLAFARLADGIWAPAAVHAGAPLPTYSPGGLLTVTASTIRPANTTAYAIGDIVGVPIELVGVTRGAGEAFRIERARLRKTSPLLSNAAFRIHLFRKIPAPTNADNGAFDPGTGILALADIEGYIGTIDVTMNYAAVAGARGVGAPATGSGITCETGAVVDHETSVWAIIEARAAYVPTSAETFYVTLEGARS